MFFDFWGKLTPKNSSPFGCSPTSSISSFRGSLESSFSSMFLACCVFPSRGGILGIFLTHHSSTLGLSQAAGSFLCVEFMFFGLPCVFSLMWAVVSSFSLGWGICFCNDLWFGLFPNDFVAFLHCFPRWKPFLCCPSIWRRDHVLLGVFKFIFGYVRAKMSQGNRICC